MHITNINFVSIKLPQGAAIAIDIIFPTIILIGVLSSIFWIIRLSFLARRAYFRKRKIEKLEEDDTESTQENLKRTLHFDSLKFTMLCLICISELCLEIALFLERIVALNLSIPEEKTASMNTTLSTNTCISDVETERIANHLLIASFIYTIPLFFAINMVSMLSFMAIFFKTSLETQTANSKYFKKLLAVYVLQMFIVIPACIIPYTFIFGYLLGLFIVIFHQVLLIVYSIKIYKVLKIREKSLKDPHDPSKYLQQKFINQKYLILTSVIQPILHVIMLSFILGHLSSLTRQLSYFLCNQFIPGISINHSQLTMIRKICDHIEQFNTLLTTISFGLLVLLYILITMLSIVRLVYVNMCKKTVHRFSVQYYEDGSYELNRPLLK